MGTEQQAGYFRSELEMETVAECVFGIVERLTLSQLLPRIKEPESLALQVVNLLLYGMFATESAITQEIEKEEGQMIDTVIQVLLAAFILTEDVIKLLRVPFQVEHWRHYQYPLWFMSVTGFFELIGSIAVIYGVWNRYLAVGAGVLFVILMPRCLFMPIFFGQTNLL